tara:strand:- start:6252 stop:6590 length:339 start_codon:yes stop_codon:yes gene_type:complete
MKLEQETQNWEQLDDVQKLITFGKLEMLKEVQEIMEGYQESYTRELIVNGIKDEEQMEKFIKSIREKLSIKKVLSPLPEQEETIHLGCGDVGRFDISHSEVISEPSCATVMK